MHSSRSETDMRGLATTLASQSPPSFKVNNPKPQQHDVVLNAPSSTNGDKYALIMVGLPARGKTLIGRRLGHYLEFFHGHPTRVFTLGDYRRSQVGVRQPHHFFSMDNEDGRKAIHTVMQCMLLEVKEFLMAGNELGRVAIMDASNHTVARRTMLVEDLKPLGVKIIFIEVICDDQDTVEENIRQVKVNMPDYDGMDPEEAVQDYKARLTHYERAYEPMCEQHLSWIKLRDVGANNHEVVIHNIRGFLPGRIVNFVMNLHPKPLVFYLTRHGQSEYNRWGKIGGDSSLTPAGDEYARALAQFVDANVLKVDETGYSTTRARLWTSSLRRTIETGAYIRHDRVMLPDNTEWVHMRPRVWRQLDELYAGQYDGMTYEEIERNYPEEARRRKKDKLGYRYPRGESYLDVIARIDVIVHEMQRQHDPLVIIAHQGILRIIYSYFMGLPRDQAPTVSIPLNTIIKLEPGSYSCREERIRLLEIPPEDGGVDGKFSIAEPPSC